MALTVKAFLFQAGNGNLKYMDRVLTNRKEYFSPYQMQALQKIISSMKPKKIVREYEKIALKGRVVSALCPTNNCIYKISCIDGVRETFYSFLNVKEIIATMRVSRYFRTCAPDICMKRLERQMHTRSISFSDLDVQRKAFHRRSLSEVMTTFSDLAKQLDVLDFSNSPITDGELSQMSYGQEVRTINFSFCYRITDDAIVNLAKNWPHLTSIDLSGCSQLTDKAFLAIADQFPNLTSISLIFCEEFSNAALQSLAKKCPLLTEVNLSGCTQLKTNSILVLLKNCLKMQKLQLDHRLQGHLIFGNQSREFAIEPQSDD